MANREALRELQSRLASRLQAARTEGVQASWLAVEAGGRGLLFPLSQSGEIFPLAATLHVPYTLPWFLGVVNLRGGLYGVADLAAFLAGTAPAHRSEIGHAQARLVVLNPALEVNCALLIDRLAGLRGLDAFTASAAAAAGAPAWYGSTYTDAQGAVWQEIDLQALSQHPQFLAIGAAS